MPIYEYRCRKCSHEFELMRRVAQMDDPARCPACRSKATGRKVSAFVVTGRARVDLTYDDVDPDEYQLEHTDHSDEPDWGDF